MRSYRASWLTADVRRAGKTAPLGFDWGDGRHREITVAVPDDLVTNLREQLNAFGAAESHPVFGTHMYRDSLPSWSAAENNGLSDLVGKSPNVRNYLKTGKGTTSSVNDTDGNELLRADASGATTLVSTLP